MPAEAQISPESWKAPDADEEACWAVVDDLTDSAIVVPSEDGGYRCDLYGTQERKALDVISHNCASCHGPSRGGFGASSEEYEALGSVFELRKLAADFPLRECSSEQSTLLNLIHADPVGSPAYDFMPYRRVLPSGKRAAPRPLSDEDKQTLIDWQQWHCRTFVPENDSSVAINQGPEQAVDTPSDTSLGTQVLAIFDRKCSSCHHSDPARRSAAQKDKTRKFKTDDLDAMKAHKRFVKPGNPENSRLMSFLITDKNNRARMPKVGDALSEDELLIVEWWIRCLDEQVVDARCEGEFLEVSKTAEPQQVNLPPAPRIALSALFNLIERDSERVLARDPRREQARYITLANLHNQGLGPQELDVMRAGLARALNSLSTEFDISSITPVDDGKNLTYRIFLSDYGWTPEQWEALVYEYPYRGFRLDDGEPYLDAVVEDTNQRLGTDTPLVRADWLVRIITHPGRYEALLGLPSRLDLLTGKDRHDGKLALDINTQRSLDRDDLIRGGFAADDSAYRMRDRTGRLITLHDSGVSGASRIIERQSIGAFEGYFWQSFDFNDAAGGKDVVPLRPFEEELLEALELYDPALKPFYHDGGEFIFSLPNGLQGYWITTSNGTPLMAAPTNIVNLQQDNFDPKDTPGARLWEWDELQIFAGERDFEPDQILNGITCMSCHAQGLRKNTDVVGEYFQQNWGRGLLEGLDARTAREVSRIYDASRLDIALDRDNGRFKRSVLETYAAIGLSETSPGWLSLVDETGALTPTDPVTKLALHYTTSLDELVQRGNLDKLNTFLAHEFWAEPQGFDTELRRRVANPAVAGMMSMTDEGVLRRELGRSDQNYRRSFECEFAAIAEALGWLDVNRHPQNALQDLGSICSQGVTYQPPHNKQAKALGGEHYEGEKPASKGYSQDGKSGAPAEFSMEILPAKASYNHGESLKFRLHTAKACQPWFIDLGNPEKGLTILAPFAHDRSQVLDIYGFYLGEATLKAGESRTIPVRAASRIRVERSSQAVQTVLALCIPKDKMPKGWNPRSTLESLYDRADRHGLSHLTVKRIVDAVELSLDNQGIGFAAVQFRVD